MHSLSVVIPVYRGESSLAARVDELTKYRRQSLSPGGVPFVITELVLVYDNGADDSARVIRELSAVEDWVRPIWLSKNYGQHAATLAGMASSIGDWVVTVDEDGQQDPADIGVMLDAALKTGSQVVYARPQNRPPHGVLRNFASRRAKAIAVSLSGKSHAADYNSYRLILGSVARGVAAYAGPGVYLDVALGWVAGRFTTAPTFLRGEDRSSGYSGRALLSHFWRLVISSGTRVLRLVSVAGVVLAVVGVLVALWVVIVKLFFGIDSAGWASTVVILLLGCGAILFTLGVIAEYVGANVNMAMGKPAYFVTTDPADGPLGRHQS